MKLDFISDTNGEIHIKDGDFVIADNSLLQAKIITYASKGEIRNNPQLGFGINRYLGSKQSENLLQQTLQRELRKENIQIKSFSIDKSLGNFDISLEVY